MSIASYGCQHEIVATISLTLSLLAITVLQSGCGLIVLGPTQRVRVASQPLGASIEIGSQHGVAYGITPAEIVVSRRRPHIVVIRASKEGYGSACKLLVLQRERLLVALDSIPAAIPLAIDAMAGTWPGRYPSSVELPLEPLPEGWSDVLPAAPAILDAFRSSQVNFCEPSPELKTWMDLRSRYAKRAAQVVVSAGDLSRNYDIVGRVDVNAAGVDYVVWSFWRIGAFGSFNLQHYEYKEDPAAINELLKYKAFQSYGDGFDAIVNVHYEDMPGNAMSGGGVVVRFTAGGRNADQPSRETRLLELQTLFERGLITREEYERKRAAIVNEL